MPWNSEQICKIAALTELKNGLYVNLGIGMPTNVSNYIPKNMHVTLQSENGMLGIGPFPYEGQEDADLINAGKETITETQGCSYFDSATSFAMIRGSHIDLTILGALQVSDKGDLANWTIPGKMLKGMGGAMDLVANVKRVVVIMDHVAKDGSAKLVSECIFPLTGAGVVNRVITNLGIFDINSGLELIAKSSDVTLDEIKSKTGSIFHINWNDDLIRLIDTV
jgi:3-oxoacid CoA-transferase subunit B